MVVARTQYDRLLHSLYLSSAGFSEVDEFFGGLRQHLGSHYCGYIAAQLTGQSGAMIVADGISESDMQNYQNHYAERNIVMARGMPRLMRGEVANAADYISDSELERSEFYADYMRPLKMFHSFGIMFSCKNDWIYNLILSREKHKGAFSSDEVTLLKRLKPHIEAALRITHEFGELRESLAASRQGFEHISSGVLLLGVNGQVEHANAVAKSLLDDGTLLTSHSGILNPGIAASRELRRIVRKMILGLVKAPAVIQVQPPDRKESVIISVYPLGKTDRLSWLASRTANYILFCQALFEPSSACTEFLSDECGLTKRELELLRCLMAGSSLSLTSKQMGIQIATTRSHLKSIYLKTQTHSQAQLMILLARLNSIL